jgi:O-succinylbenzoate synthase
VRGNPFARCGFENAFWDLTAATTGRGYPELIQEEMEKLGVAPEFRRRADRIASGAAVGIPESEDPGQLRDWVAQYRDEGYRRVKIKIRPDWDVAACAAARAALGPDFMLWADANAAYDLRTHLEALQRLDDFNLAFLEQPLHHDDLLDHAALTRLVRTPLCLDESLKSSRVARQALQVRASRIWNVKVQRVGGLLEAIRIYAVAVAEGVALWGGTMPESGIGAQAILALASFAGFVYPADIEPSDRWYASGIDPLALRMDREGWIAVPPSGSVKQGLDEDRYRSAGRVLYP